MLLVAMQTDQRKESLVIHALTVAFLFVSINLLLFCHGIFPVFELFFIYFKGDLFCSYQELYCETCPE